MSLYMKIKIQKIQDSVYHHYRKGAVAPIVSVLVFKCKEFNQSEQRNRELNQVERKGGDARSICYYPQFLFGW